MPVDNNTHHQIERSLGGIDWSQYLGRSFTPSPAAWEDQILYFLMLDRFSDGREKDYIDNQGNRVSTGSTEMFRFPRDAYTADRDRWADAGNQWLGGTLKGLESKIGYLKRLGVGTVWVSPMFKQVTSDHHSYHGYGIQNFLDVDPHFGTRQDLIDLVNTAHAHGIYVILDIIFNHAGDVFGYDADRYETEDDKGNKFLQARWDGNGYRVAGYRNAFGESNIPFGTVDSNTHGFAWPNDAVWPAELQPGESFTRKGKINNWDYDPEYYEGDFETLKDIHHGHHDRDQAGNRILDRYRAAPALQAVCEAFKFWIALADVDGFRVDTVKHVEPGAMRYFVSVIQEFAQTIGKENFYLIGEVTGGRERAFTTLEQTGLDAALGINDIPDKLDYLAKGYREPADYFNLFRNSILVDKSSHVWFGKHVVTLFDDHDQVRKGESKARFCGDKQNRGYESLPVALGLNFCSMGIPCLYYGTEQAFDGAGKNDRFLRECMFGGRFGSLQSTDRHFFNEDHEIYRLIARLSQVRREHIALRRGRQYLREISASGEPDSFGPPHMIGQEIRSVVPWSRIFSDREVLVAVNTDLDHARTVWVTVDVDLHRNRQPMTCLLSTDLAQEGASVPVEARNGRAVQLTVPPGGVVIYQ